MIQMIYLDNWDIETLNEYGILFENLCIEHHIFFIFNGSTYSQSSKNIFAEMMLPAKGSLQIALIFFQSDEKKTFQVMQSSFDYDWQIERKNRLHWNILKL